MMPAPPSRRLFGLLTGVLGALVLLVVTAAPAAAHVDLASSTPVEGAEVEGPLEEIELRFTEAIRPAGDGLVLLAEDNSEVPSEITQVDGTTLLVVPDDPLSGGTYAVTWSVQAGDAHPRHGFVTFAVAPAPTGSIGGSGSIDSPPESTVPAPEPETTGASDPAEPDDTTPARAFASLEVGPNTLLADWMGRLARWASVMGVLVGVGALVFGAAVPLRTRGEVRSVGFWIRRAGLLALAAVPFEVVAQSALLRGGSIPQGLGIDALAAALGGSFGWAVLLRLAGSAGLLWGTQVVRSSNGSDHQMEQMPVASVAPGATATLVESARSTQQRLDLHRSPVALVGSALLLFAYLFDGHTVTAAPALLVRLADMIHVAAAATWVGGVAMLAVILRRRRTLRERLDAGPLALRFSVIATVAVSAVGAAGLILAWSILDSFGELFSTGWGRVLIAKLIAVGVTAAVGAYNHFVVVPGLTEAENAAPRSDLLSRAVRSETRSDLFRRTVRSEAVILIVVAALTAVLVGLAS